MKNIIIIFCALFIFFSCTDEKTRQAIDELNFAAQSITGLVKGTGICYFETLAELQAFVPDEERHCEFSIVLDGPTCYKWDRGNSEWITDGGEIWLSGDTVFHTASAGDTTFILLPPSVGDNGGSLEIVNGQLVDVDSVFIGGVWYVTTNVVELPKDSFTLVDMNCINTATQNGIALDVIYPDGSATMDTCLFDKVNYTTTTTSVDINDLNISSQVDQLQIGSALHQICQGYDKFRIQKNCPAQAGDLMVNKVRILDFDNNGKDDIIINVQPEHCSERFQGSDADNTVIDVTPLGVHDLNTSLTVEMCNPSECRLMKISAQLNSAFSIEKQHNWRGKLRTNLSINGGAPILWITNAIGHAGVDDANFTYSFVIPTSRFSTHQLAAGGCLTFTFTQFVETENSGDGFARINAANIGFFAHGTTTNPK